MPTVDLFFMCAMLFNCKRCCAKEDSCMEMRAIVNGWTQEGMNGVQEAVYSGWWKQRLALGACHDVPSVGKSLSQWRLWRICISIIIIKWGDKLVNRGGSSSVWESRLMFVWCLFLWITSRIARTNAAFLSLSFSVEDECVFSNFLWNSDGVHIYFKRPHHGDGSLNCTGLV